MPLVSEIKELVGLGVDYDLLGTDGLTSLMNIHCRENTEVLSTLLKHPSTDQVRRAAVPFFHLNPFIALSGRMAEKYPERFDKGRFNVLSLMIHSFGRKLLVLATGKKLQRFRLTKNLWLLLNWQKMKLPRVTMFIINKGIYF